MNAFLLKVATKHQNLNNYVQVFSGEGWWGIESHLVDIRPNIQHYIFTVLSGLVGYNIGYSIDRVRYKTYGNQEITNEEALAAWVKFVDWLGPFHHAMGDGFMSFPLMDFVVLAQLYHGHQFEYSGSIVGEFLPPLVQNANWKYLEITPVAFKEGDFDWKIQYDTQSKQLTLTLPKKAQTPDTISCLTVFILALTRETSFEVGFSFKF